MNDDLSGADNDDEVESESLDAGSDPQEAGAVVYPSVEEIDALLPDFKITEKIGEGGMGLVFRAWQERLERYVAIKVLPKLEGGSEEMAEQFRIEARTMAALHHSHIATVYDFGVTGGLNYLVMEHVDGSTLYEHFYARTYGPPELIALILQVCDALSYAHGSGVVHRDIKSANILIGQDGMSKVVDFGLSTLQEAPGVLRRRRIEGATYGTPGYSAPEMFHLGAHIDHRADVFSLAVVLYEGLTGKTLAEAWVSPSQAGGAPAGVDQIIRKATKKDPRDRYQSIEQFANAIRQLERSGPAVRAVPVRAGSPSRAAQMAAASASNTRGGFPVVALVCGLVGLVIVIMIVSRGGGGSRNGSADSDSSVRDKLLSTVGEERAAPLDRSEDPRDKPHAEIPEASPIEAIDPVPISADPVEMPAELPVSVIQAEKALNDEMAEFDDLFAQAYEQLATKYVGALERLRAGAPPAGIEAIESEKALVLAGASPPTEDAAGLYQPLAALRPVLRGEYDKLRLPIANARIAVLDPHVEKLVAIRSDVPDGEVGNLLDSMIGGHESTLGKLRLLLELKAIASSDAPPPPAGGDVSVEHRSLTVGANGQETIAQRGSGIGIFSGITGKTVANEDALRVLPAGEGGSWDLVRDSVRSFLYGTGIFYQNSAFDFSKASFETIEWQRGGPRKRLISGGEGFAMISGIRGRIGRGTDFSISYDPKSRLWTCDGKGSRPTSTILVTKVAFGGNSMLKMESREYPWKADEPEVKMIHKDEGFCVLTGLHGPFEGGGEAVKLRIDETDGYWYLGGKSGVGGIAATATAFIFPKP